MAIAASWAVNNTAVTTTAGTVYTTTAGYKRDLVVTNGGASTIFIGMGVSSVATSVASFSVPPGGTVVLTQCQVPASTPITACTGAGSSTVSIGYGSLVNYT